MYATLFIDSLLPFLSSYYNEDIYIYMYITFLIDSLLPSLQQGYTIPPRFAT